jgi:thiamine kinase-like enzyme
MQVKYIYDWDSDKGVASCIIYYNDSITGVGSATCHPIDNDFKSENTGKQIAQMRAEIDLIKKINNYEIKPGIVALKHVYCTMLHSTHYNPKSYEAIRIKKELAHLMDELEENKNAIKEIRATLDNYIKEKDNFYKKVKEGQN